MRCNGSPVKLASRSPDGIRRVYYVHIDRIPVSSSSRKGGSSSTTQQMLDERAARLDAEQDTSGQPSIWREGYNLMRCPVPPCHLWPHCWRDPGGKKHYRLKTHRLKGHIRYVEQDCELQTHDDVPEDIRHQLYAEEQQRLERKQTATAVSPPSITPINITSVLPGQPHEASLPTTQAGTPASVQLSNPPRLTVSTFLASEISL
jgi:hypothetical protein